MLISIVFYIEIYDVLPASPSPAVAEITQSIVSFGKFASENQTRYDNMIGFAFVAGTQGLRGPGTQGEGSEPLGGSLLALCLRV